MVDFSKRKSLIAILVFAFAIRIWNIWYPNAYIFDEVYHAFTAQEIAKGNPQAWEWWNTPPEGFAYEWTHPYLGKMIMAAGVFAFGQKNFAYRIPGVFFGSLLVYLVYLLAKELFAKEKIALWAAFLASFEGLMFVMSRTGMVDVYLAVFILATVLLALRKKYIWSAVFLALSISTKWTGIYIFPIIAFILIRDFIKLRKITLRKFFSYFLDKGLIFIVIPPLVYLITHFIFFTSGHNWEQFVELNKQMWWYHTNLEATHGYQSQAWTWPLMLRPVWFWVRYKQNKIGNIYNLGNPFIWWGGLLILPFIIWEIVRQFFHLGGVGRFHLQGVLGKSIVDNSSTSGDDCVNSRGSISLPWKLGLVVFCYFIFWLPWIFSPRIMFLHHYMPALPFLCILIAYVLDKIGDKRLKIKDWQIEGKLLVIGYWLLVIGAFFFFYPIYTGLMIPNNLTKIFFWLSSWK